ncbi:Tyrosinase [Entomophthora muscae]|uniref:Tyrosinase n=1 Tax=Entomophthora muscae TaxID=34485 RepID=A0ACC2T3N4_9FUNG|nr:Tyrosinase [Entomophthora muscae]
MLLSNFVLLASVAYAFTCKEPHVRKNIVSLSGDEVAQYFEAIHSLNKGKFPTKWQKLMESFSLDSKHFLPAHRLLLFKVEKALRKINPTITIPYWDCSPFTKTAAADPAHQPGLFGINTICGHGTMGSILSKKQCIKAPKVANFCPNWDRLSEITKKNDALTCNENYFTTFRYYLVTFNRENRYNLALQNPIFLSIIADMDHRWDAWLLSKNFNTTTHPANKLEYPEDSTYTAKPTPRAIVKSHAASCVVYQ